MLKKVLYHFYFPPKIIFLNNLYNKEITYSFSKKKKRTTILLQLIELTIATKLRSNNTFDKLNQSIINNINKPTMNSRKLE